MSPFLFSTWERAFLTDLGSQQQVKVLFQSLLHGNIQIYIHVTSSISVFVQLKHILLCTLNEEQLSVLKHCSWLWLYWQVMALCSPDSGLRQLKSCLATRKKSLDWVAIVCVGYVWLDVWKQLTFSSLASIPIPPQKKCKKIF